MHSAEASTPAPTYGTSSSSSSPCTVPSSPNGPCSTGNTRRRRPAARRRGAARAPRRRTLHARRARSRRRRTSWPAAATPSRTDAAGGERDVVLGRAPAGEDGDPHGVGPGAGVGVGVGVAVPSGFSCGSSKRPTTIVTVEPFLAFCRRPPASARRRRRRSSGVSRRGRLGGAKPACARASGAPRRVLAGTSGTATSPAPWRRSASTSRRPAHLGAGRGSGRARCPGPGRRSPAP